MTRGRNSTGFSLWVKTESSGWPGPINANTWTAIADFEQNDERFQIRTVTDFSRLASYTDRQEHSEDGGRHWTQDSQGLGTKVQ